MSDAKIDEIIAALRSKYTPGLSRTERQILLADSDVQKWSGQTGLLIGVLYDALALRLALGFYSNELDFTFCDQVVNELYSAIVLKGPPAFFWSVFLAFDAGEYYHDGNRSIDPVEAYTRPQIAQIIQRHAAGR